MALGQVGALLLSGGGAAEGPRGGGSRAFREVPVRPQPRPFPSSEDPCSCPAAASVSPEDRGPLCDSGLWGTAPSAPCVGVTILERSVTRGAPGWPPEVPRPG